MSDEDDIAKVIVAHGGWVATIVTALGIWILKRVLTDQYVEFVQEQKKMRFEVATLKEQMAAVLAILRERGLDGRYTWPGDSR